MTTTSFRLGLSCADCFVAPSTDEPFGLVYLEAMACELPVIGTLSGGPPSFINVTPGEPDGWLVPPDDERALAEAMVTAIDDHAERSRRGQRPSPRSPELLLATRRRRGDRAVPAPHTPHTSSSRVIRGVIGGRS